MTCRECENANKTAAAAKFQNERLVAECKRLNALTDRLAEALRNLIENQEDGWPREAGKALLAEYDAKNQEKQS